MTKIPLEGTPDDLIKLLLTILASTPPLRSLAELVQNGIDAGAQNIVIRIFTKKDKKGKTLTESIRIDDDGLGFLESFEHYSKNIGNSIKKKINEYIERKREGKSMGEFCVGMQSFRSMASELQVINITKKDIVPTDEEGKLIDDKDFYKMYHPRRMRMLKTETCVYIDEEGDFTTDRTSHGVTYILNGLTDQAKKTLTLRNIVSYLAENKRAILLHNKNLKIKVTDGKKEIPVKPQKYKGERVEYQISLPNQKDISRRGFGELRAEIYYHSVPRNDSKVALIVKGEPVYEDICQKIPEFNRPPWNSGLIEGIIQYDRLTKSPTRQDVVKDEFWDAFLEMLYELEKKVRKKVEEKRKEYQSKKYKTLMKKLEDIFSQVKREVELTTWFDGKKTSLIKKGPLETIKAYPEKANVQALGKRVFHVRAYDADGNQLTKKDDIEFVWKVTGSLGTIKPHGNDATFEAGSIVGATQLMATAIDKRTQKTLSCKIDIVITHPLRVGRLFRVKAIPGFITIPINQQREIRAVAEDKEGNQIGKGVKYFWEIVYDESKGSQLSWSTGDSVIFTPGKELGQVKIRVEAKQGNILKEDFVIISVVDATEKRRRRRRLKNIGLPQPDDYNDPTEFPLRHSYLTPDGKFLRYNTAHPDYKAVEKDEKKRQRYIANLMAKELALKECKETGNLENFGEKFLDILSKIDKYWR